MKPIRYAAAAIALPCCLLAATAAQAQKIAPGLWEHTITVKSSGALEEGMARMQERLAQMPPERRQQMEAMMARQGKGGPGMAAGMSMMSGKPTPMKVCITPEQAARDQIGSGQGDCQQVSQERSGKTMKVKFSCQREDGTKMTGEGQFTLVSDKEHNGRMVLDGTMRNGQPMHMEMDQSARWLGSDCGDVKPRQMPPAKK